MADRKRRNKHSEGVEEGWSAKSVERALWPFAALAVFATVLVGAVSAWDSIVEQYLSRPILFGSFLAVAALLLAWSAIEYYRSSMSNRLLWVMRVVCFALVAAGYGVVVVQPNYCHFARNCGPSDYEPFPSISEALISTAYAGEPQLVVPNVTVDEQRSSFRMQRNNESIHAGLENVTRLSFDYDRNMANVFESASCRGVKGEQPIVDALPVWRDILKSRGQANVALSLRDYAGYRNLIRNGGRDGFRKARPTIAELTELKRNNPAAFSLMLRWMVECVGVADPVLIWTLENRSKRSLTLSFVDYDVLDISEVKGANDVLMTPVDVQPHDIVYAKGRQTRAVSPQVRIPAQGTIAVRIAYRLDTLTHGRTWLIKPIFRTLQGPSAIGPEFKVFAAK